MSVLNSNQLPSATGLDLGSASQRWDAFLQTLDVSGASTLTGAVSCGGTFAVTGAATLGSTLAVTGVTTLSDTLVLSATRGVNYGAGTVFSHFGGGTTAVTTLDASGKATVYNGVALVGNGFPYQVAKVDSTANGANIGSTLLYAVPASGAGIYRLSGYVVLTTKDAVSSTLPALTVGWTDSETSVSTTSGIISTSTNNAVGDHGFGTAFVNAKASTNITYSTSGYVSNTPGVMLYSVHLRVEAL